MKELLERVIEAQTNTRRSLEIARGERRKIIAEAAGAKRDSLSADQQRQWDAIAAQIAEHETKLAELGEREAELRDDLEREHAIERGIAHLSSKRSEHLDGVQLLNRSQSLAQWVTDNGLSMTERRVRGEDLHFGRYLRGIATGNWSGAHEERALAEGTLSAGGYTVPTPLAGYVLDLARNATQVVQAGAQTVPMRSQTLKIPKLSGEGAPAWRNENAAVTAGDLTFGVVTLVAQSLDRLVLVSRELLEDSDPSVSQVIAHSFAAQIAVELDRAALRGSGSSPEPRGLLNTPGITTTTHGTNGTTISNYDWFLDAVLSVRSHNYRPTAHIVAPRTSTSLAKLKDSQGRYLQAPEGMLPILQTNQVPTNLTVGTASNATEVYTGQWDQLVIGLRTGFELRALSERYADNQQVGFLAHLRADVAVLQPGAFVVDTGVL
ncbi:phage major capsid protein [Smaragdicoccus niigatensis]|uniref:phage major capsid protein n=1 Tax=Smaragdicoccus niigatensis TaxID=359359 RepID=UPI00037C3D2B|nr:phage major capsid protein [Smaragdicoccus niigatensis]